MLKRCSTDSSIDGAHQENTPAQVPAFCPNSEASAPAQDLQSRSLPDDADSTDGSETDATADSEDKAVQKSGGVDQLRQALLRAQRRAKGTIATTGTQQPVPSPSRQAGSAGAKAHMAQLPHAEPSRSMSQSTAKATQLEVGNAQTQPGLTGSRKRRKTQLVSMPKSKKKKLPAATTTKAGAKASDQAKPRQFVMPQEVYSQPQQVFELKLEDGMAVSSRWGPSDSAALSSNKAACLVLWPCHGVKAAQRIIFLPEPLKGPGQCCHA